MIRHLKKKRVEPNGSNLKIPIAFGLVRELELLGGHSSPSPGVATARPSEEGLVASLECL